MNIRKLTSKISILMVLPLLIGAFVSPGVTLGAVTYQCPPCGSDHCLVKHDEAGNCSCGMLRISSTEWDNLYNKGGLRVLTDDEIKEGNEGFKCPPCGDGKHCKTAYNKAANCPDCGMALVSSKSWDKIGIKMNVAILIFDGVQIIDYTGPYEVFASAKFTTYTVAKNKDAITTAYDMSVNPSYSFEDCPKPDIVVVPGGRGLDFDTHPEEMKWIMETEKGAKHVLSICNGAITLANAGLLDNLSATTHHAFFDELARRSPTTKVIRDQKWVDNGHILTSAGLSSGVNASLYLVSKIKGLEYAISVAKWMEFEWELPREEI